MPRRRSLALLSALSYCAVSPAASFGGFDPALIHPSAIGNAVDALMHHQHFITSTATHHAAAHHPHVAASSINPMELANTLLTSYKQTLATNPLPTKMVTGAVLATAGDAIAQSREPGEYDTRRAASFASFDMAYRALQHASFPIIVEHCRGQFFTGLLGAMGASAMVTHVNADVITNYFAAMEQTLASQLGIVPFLYYPVFFALTGAIQGLSVEGSVDRAKEKFLPLMQRNLLFWIPVQFIQFGFVEENLQIPFLSVCGLAWTFILSVMAGSTKSYQEQHQPLTDDEVAVSLAADTMSAADSIPSLVLEQAAMDDREVAVPAKGQPEAEKYVMEQLSVEEAEEQSYATKDQALVSVN
jgi:hypothetical protein